MTQIPTPNSSPNLLGLPRSGQAQMSILEDHQKQFSSSESDLASPCQKSSPETGMLPATGFPESPPQVTLAKSFLPHIWKEDRRRNG